METLICVYISGWILASLPANNLKKEYNNETVRFLQIFLIVLGSWLSFILFIIYPKLFTK